MSDSGKDFIQAWHAMAEAVHKNAIDHGWWSKEDRIESTCPEARVFIDAAKIALIHSEASEALEGLRADLPSEKIPGFSLLEEELGDVVIRIKDFAARRGLRVPEAILAKHEYNKGRPFRHGGKAI